MRSNPKHPNYQTTTKHTQQPQSVSPQQSPQSSDFQQHSPSQICKPRTKMLAFIDSLYSRFKLLNKLSEQQSSQFQTQIITMLIDEDECLDAELYQETVQKIGLGTFVLEVLGGIVQKRNKFKNQYQMNRNLQEIANELEKQRLELVGRVKALDKRELFVRKKEGEMTKLIQEKTAEIEQNLKNTLLNIQEETKKRVKTLLTSVKAKEKQLSDKAANLKQSLCRLNQLQAKQKSLQQKLKLLDKKQKQRKSRQATQKQHLQAIHQSNKKAAETKNQLITLEENNKKLQQEISKLNKKLKTNQMAYRHFKDETDRKFVKFNEVSERLVLVSEEKEKLLGELEKYRTSSEKLQKELFTKQAQIQSLKIKIKLSEKGKKPVITKNNHQTTKPITTNTILDPKTINHQIPSQTSALKQPHRLIFDQLDISKIQTPFFPPNHPNNSPFDSHEDLSILDHVAESIIIMDHKPHSPDNQLNELSRTVDIQKQISNWEKLNESGMEDGEGRLSEEEEQEDVERERRYVMNMKRGGDVMMMMGQRGYERSGEISVGNKGSSNGKNAHKQTKTNYRDKVSKKCVQQQVSKLKQQKQESDNQSQEQHQLNHQVNQISSSIYLDQSTYSKKLDQQTDSKRENIALFDNYFSIETNSEHKSHNKKKVNKNLTSSSTTIGKSLHDMVLAQITSFMPQSSSCQPSNSLCQSLQPLTKQLLLSIINKLSSAQLKLARTLIQPLLQLLLLIFQPCTCPSHQESLTYLFSQQLIVLLQQTLLKFQAVVKDIQQKSIIILSRILLSYEGHKQHESTTSELLRFKLKDKYLKSLKVKLLLEKDQFIRSNIKFLMEYQ